MKSTIFAVAFLALGACASPPRPLSPEVALGPARAARPARVLVTRAHCGSMEYRCPADYGRTVDQIIRSQLEFTGHSLVEGDALLRTTRARHEEHQDSSTTTESHHETVTGREIGAPLGLNRRTKSEAVTTTTTETGLVVLDGPTFEDLSVDERKEVLAKSGADAALSVRVVIGGQQGVWLPDQNVEVTVKMSEGDAMVWASRCLASSNDYATVSAALEAASRCAMDGATSAGAGPRP